MSTVNLTDSQSETLPLTLSIAARTELFNADFFGIRPFSIAAFLRSIPRRA